jgi:hypothetical protein
MLSIHDTASMRATLGSAIDPVLHTLLATRMAQLSEHDTYDLRDLAHFLVVQPGDTLEAVSAVLGFSPMENLVDGCRFGDDDFMPSGEWILDHGGWLECPYILSDEGFGWVLIVQDAAGVEPELLALFHTYATKADV